MTRILKQDCQERTTMTGGTDRKRQAKCDRQNKKDIQNRTDRTEEDRIG
jgi:hypothetical protein